ncbi:MAG: hypothetical protein HC944_04990 [Nanoarchaeota archaeon]|nr:hypothetical protein [Nanoarchaeota archaeon]
MNNKIILPALLGIIIIGITQYTFAEELETMSFIMIDVEQIEQPSSRYNSEQVTIFGFVENYTRGLEVGITLTHPDGSIEELNTYATKDGEIYMIIQVNGESQIGGHQLTLKYDGAELASTTFEVLEKPKQ